MESITINIVDKNQKEKTLEIPLDVPLSLMEVLKGEGYNIEAICGGMAICGTCRIEVLNASEVSLEEAQDYEVGLLESLPDYDIRDRLACQIKISEKLNHLRIKIHEEIFV